MRLPDHEKKFLKRIRARFRAIKAAPVVDVVGLVAPSGPGGARHRGEVQWSFSVDLEPWRIVGGPLRSENLHVQRLVSEKELDRAMKVYQPGNVVRLRCRVAIDPTDQTQQALLVKLRSANAPDKELRAASKRLATPTRHKDRVFGVLVLDRALDWWQGKAKWLGRWVRVAAEGKTEAERDKALETGRALWKGAAKWDKRLRSAAVSKLLKTANAWARQAAADNGEPRPHPIDAKAFAAGIRLLSVTVKPDGSFEVEFSDGEMFGDHSILVTGNLKKGAGRVELIG